MIQLAAEALPTGQRKRLRTSIRTERGKDRPLILSARRSRPRIERTGAHHSNKPFRQQNDGRHGSTSSRRPSHVPEARNQVRRTPKALLQQGLAPSNTPSEPIRSHSAFGGQGNSQCLARILRTRGPQPSQSTEWRKSANHHTAGLRGTASGLPEARRITPTGAAARAAQAPRGRRANSIPGRGCRQGNAQNRRQSHPHDGPKRADQRRMKFNNRNETERYTRWQIKSD